MCPLPLYKSGTRIPSPRRVRLFAFLARPPPKIYLVAFFFFFFFLITPIISPITLPFYQKCSSFYIHLLFVVCPRICARTGRVVLLTFKKMTHVTLSLYLPCCLSLAVSPHRLCLCCAAFVRSASFLRKFCHEPPKNQKKNICGCRESTVVVSQIRRIVCFLTDNANSLTF